MLEKIIKKIPYLNRKYLEEELHELSKEANASRFSKYDPFANIAKNIGIKEAIEVAKNCIDSLNKDYASTMEKVSDTKDKKYFHEVHKKLLPLISKPEYNDLYIIVNFCTRDKSYYKVENLFKTLNKYSDFDKFKIANILRKIVRDPATALDETLEILNDENVYNVLKNTEGNRFKASFGVIYRKANLDLATLTAEKLLDAEISNILDFYEDFEGFDYIIHSAERADQNKLRDLAHPKATDLVIQYKDNPLIIEPILRVLGHFSGEKEYLRVIELFENVQYDAKVVAVALTASKKPEVMIEICERYKDHRQIICNSILQKEEVCNMEDLLDSEVYHSIIGSKQPDKIIEKILCEEYYTVKSRIKDREVVANISYAEIDKIIETTDFIERIHSQRGPRSMENIRSGFYTEMNRAISQGRNYNQKLGMIHVYCSEVKQRIMDNASELMVVTNG